MPHLTLPIAPGGPLIDCFVAVSQPRRDALLKAQKSVPPPIAVRALIDTGASCTCVDPRIVRHLQLSPLGSIPVHTPSTMGTAHQCAVYDAAIYIVSSNGTLSIGTLPIVETHLTIQGFDVLIGRDVLAKCVLVYDGTAGTMTLSF